MGRPEVESTVPAADTAAKETTSTTTTAPSHTGQHAPDAEAHDDHRVDRPSPSLPGQGVVTAQNMMYTHTMTAYDRILNRC